MASASASEPAAPVAVDGRLLDPGGSRPRSASLVASTEATFLVCGVDREAVDLAAATVSGRVGSILRQIAFADGRLFETGDNDGVDALLLATGRRRPLVHRLEGWNRWLIATCVVLVLAIVALVRWGLPAGSDLVAALVPAETEALIGEYSLQALDEGGETGRSTATSEERERARAIFAELLDAQPDDGTAYALVFRNGHGRYGIGANALALPGGTIVVTDEMLAAARDDDALAGIFAHEMGHVHARHPLRLFVRTLGISAISTIALGDPGALGSAVASVAGLGFGLSYSRGFEREADRHAATLMRATGRDPRALGLLLLRLAPAGSDPTNGWFSSHPTSEERVKALE